MNTRIWNEEKINKNKKTKIRLIYWISPHGTNTKLTEFMSLFTTALFITRNIYFRNYYSRTTHFENFIFVLRFTRFDRCLRAGGRYRKHVEARFSTVVNKFWSTGFRTWQIIIRPRSRRSSTVGLIGTTRDEDNHLDGEMYVFFFNLSKYVCTTF